MKLLLLIKFLFISGSLCAQVTFNTQRFKQVKRASINVSNIREEFKPEIRYLEPGHPGGDKRQINLEHRKKLVEQRYPRNSSRGLNLKKKGAQTPSIIKSFEGNPGINYPLDNHVAVSQDGQIISCVNYNFAVFDSSGKLLSRTNLNDFTSVFQNALFNYDPKVLYDWTSDRFIIAMISGFNCKNSSIIIAFSETNDATGSWNLYQVDGCPIAESWADYPMISFTKNELILTVNQIENEGSWREDFEQSVIWIINKENGYQGEVLDVQLFTDIEYNGQKLRNLCPVKYGLNTTQEKILFLSNRPLEVQNDSIWIIELNEVLGESSSSIEVDVMVSDMPYGVPPNAKHPRGNLQTNDARILDAIYDDGWIQFVCTSVDTTTGYPTVYHGIINDLLGAKRVAAQILSDSTEYAYPSIAYTGEDPGAKEVIIIASHASVNRFPGLSCIYFDNDGNYSEWKTIKEGIGGIASVDVPLRWGDYTSAQRLSPSNHVFVSSSFGKDNNQFSTWLAELAPPGIPLSSNGIKHLNLKSYPNPANERVIVQFDSPSVKERKIGLYHLNGKLLKLFHLGKPKKSGLTEFVFSVEPLPKGTYNLIIHGDDQVLAHQKIVVH